MTHLEYLNIIHHDLNSTVVGTDRVAGIAVEIVNFFKSHDPNHHSHLSFQSFREILTPPFDNAHLAYALAYLCNVVPFLSMEFEFYDQDDDSGEFHELTSDDIRDAELHGSLVHPETGALITNYKDKVFIYYTPSESARQLYAGQ
jgi:hypothetical protein